MALNINGTTGISGVDGSASAPALTGTDSNTGINFASDTVNINTGGSTRATINSSGMFLVGTTTAAPYSTRLLTVGDTSFDDTSLEIRSSSTTGRLYFTDSAVSGTGAYMASIIYDHASNFMKFETNGGNERMRIDSSGGLRVGTTSHLTNGASNSKLSVANSGTGYAAEFQTSSITGGYAQLYLQSADTTTSQNSVTFARISGGSVSIVGTITTGTSSTSYNTSSDYRLKENAVAISDGITRLKTLKPYRFNWKVDPSTTVDGFFAHEVTAVPEAVTGTKDEISTDEDGAIPKGEPIYQSIDQSKLVPLLTAALQEAVAKIEVLETKVAALEAG